MRRNKDTEALRWYLKLSANDSAAVPKKINQSVLRIDMFIFSKEWPSVWGRRTLRLAKLERKKRDSMTVGSVIGGKNNDDDDVNDAIGNACRLQWGEKQLLQRSPAKSPVASSNFAVSWAWQWFFAQYFFRDR